VSSCLQSARQGELTYADTENHLEKSRKRDGQADTVLNLLQMHQLNDAAHTSTIHTERSRPRRRRMYSHGNLLRQFLGAEQTVADMEEPRIIVVAITENHNAVLADALST
jgi:hypothetical protein